MNNLLTIAEAAKLLNVSAWTLRRWDKNGTLKALRIGSRQDRRYELETIQKFLAKK